ncbi:hypothetical protein QQS21_006935 [Conoideocrella luteorostrata]|uniref:Uncharacterized protein n=1 Tax=Conoideocrella luteorostrata TaxID=1105319 RepID=A0AAJ0FZV0_9HYPO|nr:hypothetical protein QQS21_006935 [Conoideocrella luteorostrata]
MASFTPFEDSSKRRIVSPEFLRLRWQVKDGPLSQAIQVLEDATNSASAQQPYQSESGVVHDVARASLCSPPISSITVMVDILNGLNEEKFDEALEEEDDHDYDDDDGEWKGPTMTVKPSGEGFVTVGDYVNAVHPWLMSLREDYLREYAMLHGEDEPLPSDTEVWLVPMRIDMLSFLDSETEEPPFTDIWNMVAKFAYNTIHKKESQD